jgi:predicted nicotinamide N-methyase
MREKNRPFLHGIIMMNNYLKNKGASNFKFYILAKLIYYKNLKFEAFNFSLSIDFVMFLVITARILRIFFILSLILLFLIPIFASEKKMFMKKLFLIQFSSNEISSSLLRWKYSVDTQIPSTMKTQFREDLRSFLSSSLAEDVEALIIQKVQLFHSSSNVFQSVEQVNDQSFQEVLYDSQPTHLLVDLQRKNDPVKQSTPLLLKGRHYSLENGLLITSKDLFSDSTRQYTIQISEKHQAVLGTGLISWDGSVILAKYLEQNPSLVANKSVLEVGSGTGVVGISCYFLNAKKVLLTDLEYTIDNLRSNIEHNLKSNVTRLASPDIIQSDVIQTSSTSSTISSEILDWKNETTYPLEESWDVIVGADVIWLEDLVESLVHTLSKCSSSNTIVYLAHQVSSCYCIIPFLSSSCSLHYRPEASTQMICFFGYFLFILISNW